MEVSTTTRLDVAPSPQVTTIGIDLAKREFQIHSTDQRGTAVLRKQFRRDQVALSFANLMPCLVEVGGF